MAQIAYSNGETCSASVIILGQSFFLCWFHKLRDSIKSAMRHATIYGIELQIWHRKQSRLFERARHGTRISRVQLFVGAKRRVSDRLAACGIRLLTYIIGRQAPAG